MTDLTNQEKIDLFQNLFHGRKDVFAIRWQSADGERKGYTPVCVNEWRQGICKKLHRGKCRDCTNKHYASWNDSYLTEHLLGKKAFGIYPLLEDGSSHFLAIDFDGNNWKKDVIKFIEYCKDYNLKSHLERSSSGNGCHLWFFFEEIYMAEKSRLIFQTLLENTNLINKFDKDVSFDRIFPCQDTLDKDGIGNLILLPLNGKYKILGNTLFLDPKTLEPVDNQWEYLTRVEKIKKEFMDQLYKTLFHQKGKTQNINQSKLQIELSNELIIQSNKIPPELAVFLKDRLNFANQEYLIKKRMGVGTFGLEKYFNLIEKKPNQIAIPRGFFGELTEFLDEQNIPYNINDGRIRFKEIKFKSSLKLHEYQAKAIIDLLLSEQGILVAPPGSGKTIIGIELIARLKQPILIIVHKRQIFNQWLERIESFLNIPKKEIGQFCSTKKQVGEKITVAMIQTLNRLDPKEVRDRFGMVLVDECHHMPAKMFRQTIVKLNPYYLYGLTATPERKYKDERLIFIYLGEILHTIEHSSNVLEKSNTSIDVKNTLEVKIIETNFNLPFKVSVNNSQLMLKILVFDTSRNSQIVSDIQKEANRGKKCLVLTERKEHAEALTAYLNKEMGTITLTGDLTDKQRKEKMKQIESCHFQVLIATGQLLGEGTDIGGLDCLFLVYPFSFHGKLTQYIGRITRNFNEDKDGTIYDYRDSKVEYLDRIFKRRASYYEKNNFRLQDC
ncbi:restriction endonuclease subunit R [bacterium (Candidatus Howlettbacteria) CG_4_10_14_0_8_um_filter_40_9]|nr:MAG: restriction endonuclease subunit R [bacterium (Candidatus Howlettbacteria) CG_4_10_14_0_8_um_filter_40_9]